MTSFFSISGRIGRSRLIAVGAVSTVIVALLYLMPWDTTLPVALGCGTIAALVIAKLAAEIGRRLHDMGRSAKAGAWAALLLGLITLGSLYLSLEYDRAMLPVTALLAAALLYLAVRPGDAGPNAYGPPPADPFTSTTGEAGRAAVMLPVLCVVATIGTVLGLASLNDNLRRSHERQYRDSLQPQPGSDENIYAEPAEGNAR